MNISPQLPTQAGEPASLFARDASIIMGRQGYIFVVLRLIGMELYKIRRRALSKALGSIIIAIAILPFLAITAGTLFTLNTPLENFQPPCQAFSPGGQPLPPAQGPGADCPVLTTAQLESMRQTAVVDTSISLRLPSSLNIAVQIAFAAGAVLTIILIGTVAGGEYSIGTIRLLFTRGPTRTQYLLGKLGAACIVIFCGFLLMVGLGILIGQVLNPLSGVAQSGDFFDAGWLGHAVMYVLIAMLEWLVFGAIAIFFGTLGRSTVAGVVGAIIWLVAEPILGGLLGLLGNLSPGPFGDFLRAIPDYLISNNVNNLLGDQSYYLFHNGTPSETILRSVLVLAVYFVLFIGMALWLNQRRDITN